MKIAFIIPFHNEEKNVVPMVERVIKFSRKREWEFEVIPVDDRSGDSTGMKLKQLARKYKTVEPVFRKDDGCEKGNTMGKALLEGTKLAKAEIIIWTMGDLADDTQTYDEIVKKINDGYDLVFGSRYMPGGSRGNLDPLKAFLSSWGTLLARFLFGLPVHDITNAFRGFRKSIIGKLNLESEGFSISPEFAIKAYLSGYKLGEVPTLYTNRVEGVSNFKLYKMTKSYLFLFINLFIKYKILSRNVDSSD